MDNVNKSFLWLCLTVGICTCQQFLPFGRLNGFHHEIAFPAVSGEFHTSTASDQQPIRSLSAGFHLNPPPPLPLLQSFPINPQFYSTARNSFGGSNGFQPGGLFGIPLKNLFTPNTGRQRPESDGQEEEYRKYLKEEAEELEKEKQENDVTTDFAEFSLESTAADPEQKSFVRVNVQGKDYSYAT